MGRETGHDPCDKTCTRPIRRNWCISELSFTLTPSVSRNGIFFFFQKSSTLSRTLLFVERFSVSLSTIELTSTLVSLGLQDLRTIWCGWVCGTQTLPFLLSRSFVFPRIELRLSEGRVRRQHVLKCSLSVTRLRKSTSSLVEVPSLRTDGGLFWRLTPYIS